MNNSSASSRINNPALRTGSFNRNPDITNLAITPETNEFVVENY